MIRHSTPTPLPHRLFRALADRTRLRIVNLLARGTLCVCDIQRILRLPQSSISRHLALLKAAGLIRDRRDGMRTFYALTDWDTPLARGVLAAVRAHLADEEDCGRDVEIVTEMRRRDACHVPPKSWQRRGSPRPRRSAGVEA
jgi:ArsR family transcriptional regulator, arsenate/arsenite/antimonite-responsive transcriptional repressor